MAKPVKATRTWPTSPSARAFRSEGRAARPRRRGFDAIEEETSGGGELGAAAGAVEQVGAERGFKLREGTAQSGLGDGEGLGGFSKVQLAGQLAEIDEVAEFERILVVAGHESGMVG
jgi:hypothetical protein